MTSRWIYQPLTAEEQKLESELARRYANVVPVSELLVQRGVHSISEAEKFFHPSLRDLHDPFLMPDMDKAVERLDRAMGAKERIMSMATMMWTAPPPWRSSTATCRISTPKLSITYPPGMMKVTESLRQQ